MCDKFKVGDRFKCFKASNSGFYLNRIYEISRISQLDNYPYVFDDTGGVFSHDYINKYLTKIGEPMSKYEGLKNKIEGLSNGWDKEADDVLQEINSGYYLCIKTTTKNCVMSCIQIEDSDHKIKEEFGANSQCEKMTAFKKALLWLLDHSNIKKDEKQDKIDALKQDIKELQKKIGELE